ncbi:MAG TPA: acyl-CoA carboxylase subunit epsilon [Nocardioidaceae bacterium]|nr:acyl-CoA carboxylase subunit epsilon [Nocardioidaceae bacterium]
MSEGASSKRVSEGEPLLRVVRGTPTPQELAALVAVVAARRAGVPPREAATRSEWGRPTRSVRAPLHPAVGGWQGSALPR